MGECMLQDLNKIVIIILVIGMILVTAASNITKRAKERAHQVYQGTAYFINLNGDLATAAHMVRNMRKLYIIKNNQFMPVSVVGEDDNGDVAIVHADTNNKAYIGLTTDYEQTEAMEIYGYPLANIKGQNLKMNGATVSTPLMIYGDITLKGYRCEGNSGSPVVNHWGQSIGVLIRGEGSVCGYTVGLAASHRLIQLAMITQTVVYSNVPKVDINFKQFYNNLIENETVVLIYGED